MGTRSITTIRHNGTPFVAIYRQYDGYPTGHGQELANILAGHTMVNGIPGGKDVKVFNGPNDMAATIIARLKGDQTGNVYVYGPDTTDMGQDYDYIIDVAGYEDPQITILNWGEKIFQGTVQDFEDFCQNPEYAD